MGFDGWLSNFGFSGRRLKLEIGTPRGFKVYSLIKGFRESRDGALRRGLGTAGYQPRCGHPEHSLKSEA